MFENGLTVAELKKIIADWPETDCDGEPCEVWIGRGNKTNQVTEVWPLNYRSDDFGSWCDILLASD